MTVEKTMEKIVSLCKSRGFIFPGSEIYGGLANAWDYGPLGVEFKNNVKKELFIRFDNYTTSKKRDVFEHINLYF